MRDRLVEMLCNVKCEGEECFGNCPHRIGQKCNKVQRLAMCSVFAIADHLLAEGVIVPPCKVGSIVYTISRKRLKKWKVCFIGYNSQDEFKMHIATEKFTEMLEVWDYNIGKTVFLTREEAEKALAERSENAT